MPPDPQRSRAVLVGVADYPRMAPDRQLPTVRAGLHKFADLLRDDRIWGLPEANCVVLDQPADADTVINALRMAAVETRDALVFYYAGHGLVDPSVDSGELHLALPSSYEPGGTHQALSYAHVRREFMVNPGIGRKLVILDCCWSGKALGLAMGGDSLVAATAIAGSAVLTATAATKVALAPPGEPYTAFTGAFLRVLDDGIAGAPELLGFGTIYQHLDEVLSGQGRPRPRLGGTDTGAQLAFIRNRGWRPTAGQVPAVSLPAASMAAAYASTADRVRLLRRLGNYAEADQLQREAVGSSDPGAVRDRAFELRRTNEYEQAERLDGLR